MALSTVKTREAKSACPCADPQCRCTEACSGRASCPCPCSDCAGGGCACLEGKCAATPTVKLTAGFSRLESLLKEDRPVKAAPEQLNADRARQHATNLSQVARAATAAADEKPSAKTHAAAADAHDEARSAHVRAAQASPDDENYHHDAAAGHADAVKEHEREAGRAKSREEGQVSAKAHAATTAAQGAATHAAGNPTAANHQAAADAHTLAQSAHGDAAKNGTPEERDKHAREASAHAGHAEAHQSEADGIKRDDKGRFASKADTAVIEVKDAAGNRLEVLARPFQAKMTPEADGTFSGVAMEFNSVHPTSSWQLGPEWNDRVSPGAFTKTLAEFKANGNLPLMLWMHERGNIPGAWRSVVQSKTNLSLTGQVSMQAKSESGVTVYELMKMGAINGLSIGFRVVKCSLDEEQMLRTIEEVELAEVSIVDIPGSGQSRITDVKGSGLNVEELGKRYDAATKKADAASRKAERASDKAEGDEYPVKERTAQAQIDAHQQAADLHNQAADAHASASKLTTDKDQKQVHKDNIRTHKLYAKEHTKSADDIKRDDHGRFASKAGRSSEEQKMFITPHHAAAVSGEAAHQASTTADAASDEARDGDKLRAKAKDPAAVVTQTHGDAAKAHDAAATAHDAAATAHDAAGNAGTAAMHREMASDHRDYAEDEEECTPDGMKVAGVQVLETALRDAGLSRKEAKRLLAEGYTALRDAAANDRPTQRDAGRTAGSTVSLAASLRGFASTLKQE